MRMRLTVNLSLFISFRKLGRPLFWTGFEYKIMRNFIVWISTCEWLISKCLILCLGGLGSCDRTVNSYYD